LAIENALLKEQQMKIKKSGQLAKASFDNLNN
jgi:hypothetical protein